MYITFAELPLSTNTLQVLNPSMGSIMTRGSSWGYLIPFTSYLEKTMSAFLVWRCFAIRWLTWTLFICLWTAFLKGLYDPSMIGPPSDRPYLSYDGFEIVSIFLSLVVSGFLLCSLTNLIVFFNKLLELPPLDQLIYLFFQIPAFVCIMTMVLMEAVVILRNFLLWGWAQWFRPFQGRVILYLHEDLVHKHYQMGEIQLLL